MLTPDEIASQQFLIALRGFDRDEVQTFLNEVADQQRDLQSEIDRLQGELAAAQSELDAARSGVAAPAEAVAAAPDVEDDAAPASDSAKKLSAASEPRAIFAALGEETTRILVAAEESARSIRERAEERARTELENSRREAREEVAGARRTAAKIVSDAERRRNSVAEEVRKTEVTRDRFAEDLRSAMVQVQTAMRGLAGGGTPAGEGAKDSEGGDGGSEEPHRAGPAASPAVTTNTAPTNADEIAADEILDQIQAGIVDEPLDEPDDESVPLLRAVEREEVVHLDANPELRTPSDMEPESLDLVIDADAPSHLTLLEGGGTDDDGADGSVAAPVARRAVASDDDAAVLDLRAATLSAIRPGALRLVKRGLQEIQNGVLDDLRRTAVDPKVDVLLPTADEIASLGDVCRRPLAEANRGGQVDGAAMVGSDREPSDPDDATVATVATLRAALSHEITTSLRATLTAGIDAGEVPTSLSERIGEVFRDLKGPVVESIVDRHLVRAHAYGAIIAWRDLGVATKSWVPGNAVRCPEDMREQNAAAGHVALDAEFPTGDAVPPAHDGCDCGLAPGR